MGELQPVNPAIDGALSLDGDVEAIRRYYDGWADGYDADVGAEDYDLPNQVALLLEQVTRSDIDEPIDGLLVDPAPPAPSVLDVGCGTGLIGQRLAAAGYRNLHGIDLSSAMTERAAARGCYCSLHGEIDVTGPLPPALVGANDIAVVGGVFTVGHVPPTALAAVASLVRTGGLLVTTTRRQYYEETGYQAVSDRLVADGMLQLLRCNRDAPYTEDSFGHYWAYLVTGG